MSLTIEKITYHTPLIAGNEATLDVSLLRDESTSSETYRADVYAIRDGKTYYEATENITFEVGQSSKNATFRYVLHEPGNIYTAVDIYDSEKKLIASRKGANPDNIESSGSEPTGDKISSKKWNIEIKLPKDRSETGTLKFYIDGTMMHSCSCLGKGVTDCSSPDSWKELGGNTPTGEVEGYLYTANPEKDSREYPYVFGPYKRIWLKTPISGEFEIALKTRSGLMIHGGRCQTHLWNTEGCIRVFDNDIKIITDYISEDCVSSGVVTVCEV